VTWRRKAAWAAACGAALAIAGLATPWHGAAQGAAGDGTAGAATDAPAGLAWHACRLRGLEHDAQCASLRRPLDPARPDGQGFDLQVAVLPALARRKEPDPVFFFAGGPGQSAIALAGTVQALMARLGERRDIVLVDQRGTGRSAPLQCDAPSADEALRRAIDRDSVVAGMLACREALQRLPWGDLRFYTTPLAADDAEAVRAALGVPRIDLVAASYGTRVALEYLRRYPTHVRRVVLDGVAPPDMALPESGDRDGRAALRALLDDCPRQAACARAYPGLAQDWRRLVSAPTPALPLADPMTGRVRTAVLTPQAVYDLIRPALYQPTLGAALPHAIEEAAAGRFGPLLALGAAQAGTSPADVSEGAHFSVVCSEDMPRLASPPADDGPRYDAIYRAVCAGWPRGELPAGFYELPRSPVPVLLLSGGIDPVTPPRHAARVAAALGPLARQAVVTHWSHGVLALACMRDALDRFVTAADDAQALAVDLHCADAVPRPLAFEPPAPAPASSAPNDSRGYWIEPPDESLRSGPPPVAAAPRDPAS
jgi:pimeloyl-ACP methyl ester carboxylesterase